MGHSPGCSGVKAMPLKLLLGKLLFLWEKKGRILNSNHPGIMCSLIYPTRPRGVRMAMEGRVLIRLLMGTYQDSW